MKHYIFGLTAFGALIGFMMGLSVSPVVGAVLSILSAAAIVLIGLEPASADEKRRGVKPSKWSSLAVGVFSLATLLATVIGIFARTHNWFGRSLASYKAELAVAGVAEKEMKSYLLAFISDVGTGGTASESEASSSLARIGVLFSEDGVEDRSSYDPERFSKVSEAVNHWELGTPVTKKFAELVKMVPQDEQREALAKAYKLLVESRP